MSTFWGNDPKILQTDITQIFPSDEMDRIGQINALTRLSIILGLSLGMLRKNPRFLAIPLVFMVSIYFLVKNSGLIVEQFSEYDEPTVDNPFMNVSLADLAGGENEGKKKPAPPPSKELEKRIEEKFNYNMYTNANDIFKRNSSKRSFITNPVTTVPNNQKQFAEWLYKSPETCKEKTLGCSDNIETRMRQSSFITPNE
jgi:hypothetical protein